VTILHVRYQLAAVLLCAATSVVAFAAGLTADEGVCPLLDPGLVVKHFPAGGDNFKVRYREKPYASCTFTWKSVAKKTISVAGQIIESPGEGRLSVTRAAVRSAQPDWLRVLNQYGEEDLLEVEGIGERAVWSSRRSQLSVQDAKYLVQVAVEDPDKPDNLTQNAIAIAVELLGRTE